MSTNAAIDISVLERLPEVRGNLRAGAALAPVTWFRVGGPADVLFLPKDTDDLAHFLQGTPADIPVTVVGVGSNLLVRDGGIPGVVIRLARGFADISIEEGNRVRAGTAALDVAVAKAAAEAGLEGLEFYRGIPGSIGGALRMNAGAYGGETKDVLVEAVALDRQGERHVLTVDDMGYAYRHSAAPDDLIFVEAVFQARPGNRDEILARMENITSSREATQPIRTRTGGSTFKNPDPEQSGGRKAWQLIDAAGCRGLTRGGAQVSELHCNFLVNHGRATAADLEALGEEVRRRVEETSGVRLEWEIRRLGRS
ncbi:MAG: UDP-N-acetylmuramate dehydrogenase [Alphaproteobacteria bacterium]